MRILRVLRLFWGAALSAEAEYRLNFLMAALTSLGNFIGSIFTLFLIYRQNVEFNGWNWSQALIVMAFFTLLDGISSMFLAPNLSQIVTQVQKGTLDFVLLKPVDSQFWLSTRNLSPWGVPSVVFGLILLFYAGHHAGLTAGMYALGIIPLVLSLIILYSLWYILATTTVWFVKIQNVTQVLQNAMEAGKYPMAAYPVVLRFFFTFILPVGFLTTAPAEIMLGRSSTIGWLIGALILAILTFSFSRFFWRFALRSYTSASS